MPIRQYTGSNVVHDRGPKEVVTFMLKEIVEKIKKIKPKHKRFVVAIGGGGGAGKSTLAAKLAHKIDAAIVALDDIYLPKRDGEEMPTIDYERFEKEVLSAIREGRGLEYGRYDWSQDKIVENISVGRERNLIIEGGSVISKKYLDYYDFILWVEAPEAVRLERVLQRDGAHMRKYWEQLWLPMERKYVGDERPQTLADIVVNGVVEVQ